MVNWDVAELAIYLVYIYGELGGKDRGVAAISPLSPISNLVFTRKGSVSLLHGPD